MNDYTSCHLGPRSAATGWRDLSAVLKAILLFRREKNECAVKNHRPQENCALFANHSKFGALLRGSVFTGDHRGYFRDRR